MYDKTVRRRRAVLGLLVVLSLLLLTAYFGEAPNGRLHAVQRDFLTVVSPIQDGANKALKPVRDLFGWFGDTLHAKGQRAQSLKQTDKLRRELVADEAEKRSLRQLVALYHLDQLGVDDYQPVTATVVGKSPNIWYSTVTIDKGESSGVRVNDPVINGEGLVGKVATGRRRRRPGDLITDSSMGVSARIGKSNATGIVQPKVGEPNDLLLQLPARQHAGQRRANTSSPRAPSDARRLAVPAGADDRPGDLGQRRKRLQVGQRAPGREPAQPRHRAGADRGSGHAGGQPQPP